MSRQRAVADVAQVDPTIFLSLEAEVDSGSSESDDNGSEQGMTILLLLNVTNHSSDLQKNLLIVCLCLPTVKRLTRC